MLLGLTSPCRYPASCSAASASASRRGHRDRPRRGQRPAAQLVGQRPAGQELDDEERAAPPRLDAVDLGHRRMGHRGHGPRLGLQPHQPRDRHAGQRLDRDVALEPQVAGQPGRAHAPASQPAGEPELARESSFGTSLLDIREPAVAPRRLAGLGQASAHRALLRGRRFQRPVSGFLCDTQARDRQPGRRRQRFEERDVHRPHDPVVEAAAHHHDAEQLRARPRAPVPRRRLPSPPPTPRHPGATARSAMSRRSDARAATRRPSPACERRPRRAPAAPARRPARLKPSTSVSVRAGDQQDGGRAAPATDRAGHRPADALHPSLPCAIRRRRRRPGSPADRRFRDGSTRRGAPAAAGGPRRPAAGYRPPRPVTAPAGPPGPPPPTRSGRLATSQPSATAGASAKTPSRRPRASSRV